MIRTLSRFAVPVACLSILAACFNGSNTGAPPGNANFPFDDAATPGDDAATPTPDATTPLDATASLDAMASVDATVEASGDDAAVDANTPDTGTAPPVDAGVDVAPVPVAGCIPDIPGGHYIFGDHYLRTDGELFYAPSGAHHLVTNAGRALPSWASPRWCSSPTTPAAS